MLVKKDYKFRIYPTKEQEEKIAKTIGCSRYVFNHFLDQRNTMYRATGKGLTYNICSKQLTRLKKDLIWLKEVDSVALQASLQNLADAFSKFSRKQNKAPRFKSKNNKLQPYTTKYTNDNIRIIGNKIKLPKLGFVTFAKSREVKGNITRVTVRRNPSGRYFVSVLAETEVKEWSKTKSCVGIDLGLKDFAVLSNESMYSNPK